MEDRKTLREKHHIDITINQIGLVGDIPVEYVGMVYSRLYLVKYTNGYKTYEEAEQEALKLANEYLKNQAN